MGFQKGIPCIFVVNREGKWYNQIYKMEIMKERMPLFKLETIAQPIWAVLSRVF